MQEKKQILQKKNERKERRQELSREKNRQKKKLKKDKSLKWSENQEKPLQEKITKKST